MEGTASLHKSPSAAISVSVWRTIALWIRWRSCGFHGSSSHYQLNLHLRNVISFPSCGSFPLERHGVKGWKNAFIFSVVVGTSICFWHLSQCPAIPAVWLHCLDTCVAYVKVTLCASPGIKMPLTIRIAYITRCSSSGLVLVIRERVMVEVPPVIKARATTNGFKDTPFAELTQVAPKGARWKGRSTMKAGRGDVHFFVRGKAFIRYLRHGMLPHSHGCFNVALYTWR
mmetsp:Transcript_36538/g.79921  ORF Transcript_36538/g.79921 Transcript_36538/m.79921 type:complete len:228 (-) Transcript_36538:1236-1919(-)